MEVSLYCYYKEQKHNAQSLMGHRSEKLYNALEGTVQEDILLYYKCAAYGGSTYGCAAVLHMAVLHMAVLFMAVLFMAVLHTAVLLTEVLLTDVFLNIIAQIYQDWT